MKFLALFKKDVKCLLPLFIIALAIFIVIVYLIIMTCSRGWSDEYFSKLYIESGMIAAIWIFGIFGFMSGILQFFYFTGQLKSWAFLLHRSAGRITILSSMILSFCLMGIFLGILEFMAFKVLAIPYNIKVESVSFIYWLRFSVIGLLFYLAVVLCCLSRLKWFTTKLFPIIFAAVICFLDIDDNKNGMTVGLIFSTAAVVILLTQITHLFLKKEV